MTLSLLIGQRLNISRKMTLVILNDGILARMNIATRFSLRDNQFPKNRALDILPLLMHKYKHDAPKTRAGFEDCTQRFGSAHSVGPIMVLCDGSIRSIDYEIDKWVYSAMGSRNGSAE